VTPDEAVAALRARLDPSTGRFPGTSPTAALLFLFDRARDGDEEARRLALSALRRTPGDAVPSVYAAVAEAAVHVEAVDVARDDGLDKTARAAVDAALRAFGWSSAGEEGDEGRNEGSREGTEAHGFMTATLARAAVVLDAPGYREAASLAGEQALDRRVDPTLGTLLHSTGEDSRPAGIADYALLVSGLLQLLEASGENGWLHEAARLQGEQEERLWDARGGGYFEFPEGAARRSKDGSDGAIVSGNGVAVHNLLELSRLTGERSYRERAGRALAAFAADMKKEPLRHLTLLHAAQRLQRASSAA
jgi:hypothetical protein